FSELFVMKAEGKSFERLKSLFSGNPLIKEIISGYGFVINKKDYEAVNGILRKLGYTPVPWHPDKKSAGTVKPDTIAEAFGRRKRIGRAELILPGEPVRDSGESLDKGKYGGEMREMAYSDLLRAVNYAVLMEDRIIEAVLKDSEEGEKLIKFRPIDVKTKNNESAVECFSFNTGKRETILLTEIKKMKITEEN
ncbi:MAG: hypothetical protein ACLFQK_11630, partial [Fibrobacterota bacterium]